MSLLHPRPSRRPRRAALRVAALALSTAALVPRPCAADDAPATAPTTAPAATQPATRPMSAQERAAFDALVEQLGADDWRQRQAAEDALVKLGPAARGQLEEVAAHGGGDEVRTRAASAARRIDRADEGAATAVSLHVKGAKVKQVIDEIARQSHAEIGAWPDWVWDERQNQYPPVTIDVDAAPFWPTLLEVLRQTGRLNVQHVGGRGEGRITVTQSGNAPCRFGRCPDPRFTFAAESIDRERSIALTDPHAGTSKSDQFRFTLYADPKVKVLGYAYQPRVTEAIDDKGRPNATPAVRGLDDQENFNDGGAFETTMSFPLTYADDGAARLTKLAGSVRVKLQTKSETLSIKDVAQDVNVPHALAGMTFTIRAATPQKSGVRLSFEVRTAPPLRNRPDNGFWRLVEGIRVAAANGKHLQGAGGGGGGGNNSYKYDYDYAFEQGAAGPYSLTWEVPTETKVIDVPFEFDDLPLPTP